MRAVGVWGYAFIDVDLFVSVPHIFLISQSVSRSNLGDNNPGLSITCWDLLISFFIKNGMQMCLRNIFPVSGSDRNSDSSYWGILWNFPYSWLTSASFLTNSPLPTRAQMRRRFNCSQWSSYWSIRIVKSILGILSSLTSYIFKEQPNAAYWVWP